MLANKTKKVISVNLYTKKVYVCFIYSAVFSPLDRSKLSRVRARRSTVSLLIKLFSLIHVFVRGLTSSVSTLEYSLYWFLWVINQTPYHPTFVGNLDSPKRVSYFNKSNS